MGMSMVSTSKLTRPDLQQIHDDDARSAGQCCRAGGCGLRRSHAASNHPHAGVPCAHAICAPWAPSALHGIESAGVINQPILPVVLLLICRPAMLTRGVNIKAPRERCGGSPPLPHDIPAFPLFLGRVTPASGPRSTMTAGLHADASFSFLDSGLGPTFIFVFPLLCHSQCDLFGFRPLSSGGPPGGASASCSPRSKIDVLKRVPLGERKSVGKVHGAIGMFRHRVHGGSNWQILSILQNYLGHPSMISDPSPASTPSP